MEITGNQWKPLEINGNHWKSMDIMMDNYDIYDGHFARKCQTSAAKNFPTEMPEPGRGPPPGFAFPGVEDGGFDAQGAQTSGTGQAGHATTCGNKNPAAIN